MRTNEEEDAGVDCCWAMTVALTNYYSSCSSSSPRQNLAACSLSFSPPLPANPSFRLKLILLPCFLLLLRLLLLITLWQCTNCCWCHSSSRHGAAATACY